MDITLSPAWRATYPGAIMGVLVMEAVANPPHHPRLDARKAKLEEELRTLYAGQDRGALRAHPVIEAYDRYYRGFKKTYHVLLQLESLIRKNRPIPSGATLVEAVFMAELQDLLLTAAHDLDAIQSPLVLDVAQGDERYTRLNGQQQQLKAGDMFLADARGVISSVIYGPDQRTRLSPTTRRAIFTTYAPPGIGEQAIRQHLAHLQHNVSLITPEAVVSFERLYLAA